jgi:GTP-binding protein Era
MTSPAAPFKSGFVAVAGRPNVGKSTLVNALAGGKVAIVSEKPQTTRRRISAVVNGKDHQLVLVDLPGFQRPLDALTERMQRTVATSLEDVDGFLFVLAADERIGPGDRFVAQRVFAAGPPVVIALNKVDRLKPARIAAQIAVAAELGDFHSLHPVSALRGEGLEALESDLVELLPKGPRYFGEGEQTDLPLEARLAELVREQALALTREEVPHAIGVEVDELEDAHVRANLVVETESQKGILVGKGGSMIKEIGSRARPEIELLLGRKVFLELVVKVRPHWRRDENALERMGL